ncbi:BA75_03614T0 [Komagataella pastoris]|uniref:BA75_03614T0 n=1 Tax=Komagataella pastoris TaxID=4922 RepID=A0A1B2JGL0_PICPA|nr:BA75_03614T0 [Komagataella pastoris]
MRITGRKTALPYPHWSLLLTTFLMYPEHKYRDYKRRVPLWQYSLLVIVLLYGSHLLISTINLIHYNHKNYHAHPVYTNTVLNDFAEEDSFSSNGTLNLENWRNGTFSPKFHSIQWTEVGREDDQGYYILSSNSSYIVKSLSDPDFESVLFNESTITYNGEEHHVEDVIVSNNLQYALVVTDKKHNWRHSFFANYWLYKVDNPGEVQPLFDSDLSLNALVSLVHWSPDSSQVAFVLNNNIYLKHLNNFSDSRVVQLTYDGGENIFYGKPDWVYEEEVFESNSAMWWSPNGQFLSILRTNDTQVPVYPIPYFVQSDAETAIDEYPLLKHIKYPKAGFPNPVVDVIVYDVHRQHISRLPADDPFYNDENITNEERLITEIIWVGDSRFLTKITNRESDLLAFYLIDAEANNSKLVRFQDAKSTKSWFEIEHNTMFIPKDASVGREQDGYIDTIDVNGYNHLAYFSPPDNPNPKIILTSGEWEVVDSPSAFDFKRNVVYFTATKKSSIERHVYSVGIDGKLLNNVTDVSSDGYYSTSFSPGARFVLLSHQGPHVPYQKMLDLVKGTEEIIESNEDLKDSVSLFNLPDVKYGEVELHKGVKSNYVEIRPKNFDHSKKYPVLFFVYGGPGSQLVTKTFSKSFQHVVASELDAIVVTVDGRGTGFRGRDYRSLVRDNLGHYESLDQIKAGKIWASKPYVDENRLAIWGWSYGGYMTLKVLEQDKGETFKYGMSVAPVTNWKFYDSIYTERYMHTPQDNPNYYNSSIHEIDNLKGVKRFLLMHGTGDDNVHFQNTLKVLDLFDLHGLENYDVHVFPDSDHSIRYHNSNVIVYDKLFHWIRRAFKAGK